MRAILADQRGMAFVLVAISLLAVVSSAAIAIDIGLLLTARTESQRAAESAALAGAGWLLAAPTDEPGAREMTKEFALKNTVRGKPVVLLDEDIDVILDSAKVRARVNNVESRGTAITTFFARVFGVGRVNVRTLAAAWAAPADELETTNADCPLPIALMDKWNDTNDNGVVDEGEYYDPQGTGLGPYSIGDLIAIKVSGSETTGPPFCRGADPPVDYDLCRDEADSDNWRCWYRESEGAGGGTDVLGPRIYPATNCGPSLSAGETIWTASASGNKQSLVHTDYDTGGPGSFADLITHNPGQYWCEPPGETGFVCDAEGNVIQSSSRMRTVPIVRPDGVSGTGAGVNTTIIDFTGVFVERVSCNYSSGDFAGPAGNWNVYVRIINSPDGGNTAGNSDPGPGGTTLKRLQLIE
jgi:hypothetical protein